MESDDEPPWTSRRYRRREDAYAEFDKQGLAAVREAFQLWRLPGLLRDWATSWLALREAEASDASQSEQIDFSRRAAEAAEAAADSARLANRHAQTANKIAAAALVAALIAIAISIVVALNGAAS